MSVTNLNEISENPELAGATDALSGPVPSLPIPSNPIGAANDTGLGDQTPPVVAPTPGIGGPGTTAGAAQQALSQPDQPKPGTFAAKLKAASDQLGIPPGPGGWAKSLVGAAQSALSSVGDLAEVKPGPNRGLLGGASQVIAAQAARKQQAQKAADEHAKNMSELELNKATIASANINKIHTQKILNSMDDNANHADVDYGKSQVAAYTSDQEKLGLKGAEILSQDISEAQLQSALTDKNWNPTEDVWFPTGTIQPIDPKTGKPAIDPETNDPVHQKTYSILKVPQEQTLTSDQADMISKYTGNKFEEGQVLKGPQAVQLMQQAHTVEVYQQKTALDLEKANLDKLDTDQKVASDESYKRLSTDPDYALAVGQFPNDLAKTYQWMTGQYPAYQNGKPVIDPKTGQPVMDPRSVKAAKDNPTAATDVINAYGGQKNYDAVIEKQGEDATKARIEAEKVRHDQVIENENAQKESDKRNATLADHTDAFGNKSPLEDKEFDKRYDSFTASTQNKTLQTLEGSYDQFQNILADIDAGKETAPENIAGLFDAIGISATPLAGKGFRIQRNVIDEHIGARGLDQAAIAKLQGMTEGMEITDKQMRGYAKVALDVYKSAFANAAKEQMRTLGYVDILPRGNNTPIDPVTGGMYLKVSGGDAHKASMAANASGWVTTPQTFGARPAGNVPINTNPTAPGTAAYAAPTGSQAQNPTQNVTSTGATGGSGDFFSGFGGVKR